MADNSTAKKKRFKGVVVSTAMVDTVVVRVDRYYRHPRYGKFVRSHKRYQAHDPGNTTTLGQSVEIEEAKPVSKRKRFQVVSSQ